MSSIRCIKISVQVRVLASFSENLNYLTVFLLVNYAAVELPSRFLFSYGASVLKFSFLGMWLIIQILKVLLRGFNLGLCIRGVILIVV